MTAETAVNGDLDGVAACIFDALGSFQNKTVSRRGGTRLLMAIALAEAVERYRWSQSHEFTQTLTAYLHEHLGQDGARDARPIPGWDDSEQATAAERLTARCTDRDARWPGEVAS
jgi:hypothetical protein